MDPLPEPIESFLQTTCIADRHPCYLAVARDGRIEEAGGAGAFYGIAEPVAGMAAVDVLAVLDGLLPPAVPHECLPHCQLTDAVFAELHILRGDARDWVILLDASDQARQLQRLQQQAHEMTLLYEREARLRRDLQESREHIHDLRGMLEAKASFHDMIGSTPAMQALYELIEQIAAVDATVLIEGETGTGKELVARAIHAACSRRDGPLVTVNCAGLSDSLINSQLFGHRKGAFTDAVKDQTGFFEAANGGTIFLDEIGDIPMNTQTRILRTLEQREITRIGDTESHRVDIRILAATNKDLSAEVRAGRFREDLLYRIRVARITVPPLRQRRQDIPLLINAFLRVLRAANEKAVNNVEHETLRLLVEYHWPGNVRELRNAVEFAYIRCHGETIRTEDLPPEIVAIRDGRRAARDAGTVDERERLLGALRAANGRRTAAARLLGISRATFYRRLDACMIDPATLNDAP